MLSVLYFTDKENKRTTFRIDGLTFTNDLLSLFTLQKISVWKTAYVLIECGSGMLVAIRLQTMSTQDDGLETSVDVTCFSKEFI